MTTSTTETGQNTVQTKYSYSYSDLLDRLTLVDRAVGTSAETNTVYTYPSPSEVDTYQDQATLGDEALHSLALYDVVGRKIESRQYEGTCSYIYTQTTYDLLGRVSSRSNPACFTESSNPPFFTTYGYDGLNRLTNTTAPDGSATTVMYSGNQATSTESAFPKSVVRVTQTDALGRITQVVEDPSGLNYLTSYAYDGTNDLLKVCQGASLVTNTACSGTGILLRSFAYDDLQRLIQSQNPESNQNVVTYGYDPNGNLTSKKDANGITATMTYDGINRVTSKTFSDNGTTPSVTYCYDGSTTSPCGSAPAAGSGLYLNGRLTMVSSLASTTTYGQYDPLGRVAKSAQSTGGVNYIFPSYTYNLAGAMLSATLPSGRIESWKYDTANRIKEVDATPSGGTQKTYASITYPFTSQGLSTQLLSRGDTLSETISYNNRLQPSSIALGPTSGSMSQTSASFSLFYCPSQATSCTTNNGNVLSQTIAPLNATDTYSYDTVNRILTASEGTAWSQTYAYDKFGNRAVVAGSYVPNTGFTPQVPSATATMPYTNNHWNGATYDTTGSGNLTALNGFTYTYDAENRQTKAVQTGGPSTSTFTYSYDGDGRRVTRAVSGVTTTYVYDVQGRLAAEYASSAADSPCRTCYLTADHLGSRRVVTDGSGNLVALSDYLPFGEDISSTNRTAGLGYMTGTNINQKFTSKERDAETGLDYFGARYMSSAQGRFTSPDPDNYDARIDQPQAWNMYAYTWNNPLKYRDDDGRAVNLALAGIGAGVGFVTGFAGSAISQEIQNGSVDWGTATAYGAGGAAAGSLAGLTFGGSLVAQALAGAAVGTVGNVANGLISRGLAGEDAFNEDAMESDLANGAIGGALGAGIQFVGTVIKLPVAPKAPNPLGTVRTQLKRMAALRAWQLQRGNLNNRFSAIGGTAGAVYTNSIVQVKTSYDIRQSLIAFGYLDQPASPAQKPVVTSKICFTDENGKKVCQ